MIANGSFTYIVSSSGSIMPYNSGANVFSFNDARKWTCHYCGGLVKPELDQCPKCAGERRAEPQSSRGYHKIQYVADNIVPIVPKKKPSVLNAIRMAIGS